MGPWLEKSVYSLSLSPDNESVDEVATERRGGTTRVALVYITSAFALVSFRSLSLGIYLPRETQFIHTISQCYLIVVLSQ